MKKLPFIACLAIAVPSQPFARRRRMQRALIWPISIPATRRVRLLAGFSSARKIRVECGSPSVSQEVASLPLARLRELETVNRSFNRSSSP